MGFDVLKGHVDDGHHHIDQNHVHADGEHEENPGGHLIGCPQAGKVELANCHGQGVLDTAVRFFEVDKVGAQDKEEEANKGAKDDAELDDKGAETDETKPDCRCDLSEGLGKADKKNS